MRLRILTAYLLLQCAAGLAQAQTVPLAHKLYNKAVKLRMQHKTLDAYRTMERAIRTDPSFETAYTTLGAWYFQAHRFREAAAIYQKASYNCANGHKSFARLLAQSYLYSGQLMEAQYIVRRQGALSPEWEKLERQIEFIKQAMDNPLPDTPVNMGCRINTPMTEMYPSMTADGEHLFFTRRTKGIDEDFYRADKDSCGGWFAGRPLDYPLNTSSQEAAQMISADNHYLFFMRCENKSANGWGQGGCDLYMAYTADSVWSAPQSFGATINTPGYEGMPCLTSDNRSLYFVSDRPGGYGGLDIWVSRFEHGLWQEPKNLGPAVNTKGNETTPFIYADNKTLFFASDGHPGMGGTDLFMSIKASDSTWSPAANLGYPINTWYDETSFILSSNGKKAYFASNRDSVEANYDLYEMDFPASLQPRSLTYVVCKVYDSFTAEPLNYAGTFVNDASGREVFHFTSNRGDGSFMIPVPTGEKFDLFTDRVGYQSFEETIQFDDSLAGKYVYHPIPLLPFGYEKPVYDSTILYIFFKKNSVEITDSIRQRIHEQMQEWVGKKHFSILVNGYTDNTGTPMINEHISYQRAELIRKELTGLGFAADLIQAQGWGEASPIAGNDTEEDRDMNRRVEIVIRR